MLPLPSVGLPRTRGDGPSTLTPPRRTSRASPHTRGWTRSDHPDERGEHGFPAHAGMDPGQGPGPGACERLPRTRGDGPGGESRAFDVDAASPHTRGWTRLTAWRGHEVRGFPAHAGMDPWPPASPRASTRLPRTRGDGPTTANGTLRAWQASPHTRGWTHRPGVHPDGHDGFPAHAGMDPLRVAGRACSRRLPRTRGDGPEAWTALQTLHEASPHTRGWTRGVLGQRDSTYGFPAHAGMDRLPGTRHQERRRLPRTRGDGPQEGEVGFLPYEASPHTRGWTLSKSGISGAGRGFPAHAGMDPYDEEHPWSQHGLPRTRGDGPGDSVRRGRCGWASPHTRGWTP